MTSEIFQSLWVVSLAHISCCCRSSPSPATRLHMSSPSYPLVLSPLLNPKGASVVHELKVLAATAFNYVVAIVVVMLPSFAAIYSIIGEHQNALKRLP